jgi:arylsulfatase A-like enzyme
MYDEVLRMPTVVWSPRYLPKGVKIDAMLQQFDLVPMLLELVGLDELSESPAISALSVLKGEYPGRDAVFAEHSQDNILREVEFTTMIRTADWKLVHYLNQSWGELYDLQNNPSETQNLWDDARYQVVKQDLISRLLEWHIAQASP